MKKLLGIFVGLLFAFSCATNQDSMVQYTLAKNYFFSSGNKITVPTLFKISNENEFYQYFGEAAVKGKDGEPTPIDFKCQFVLAKVLPETDVHTDLIFQSLTKNAHTLTLKYTIKQGEKQSWTMRPFFFVIVDKKDIKCRIKEIAL